MSGGTSILAILRRRRACVGRVVLALFLCASAVAGAAPCFAMPRVHVADHGAASPSVAAPGDEHRAHAAPGHEHHAHAADRHGTASGEQPGEAHSTRCKHCPPSTAPAQDGSSGSHARCAAGDVVADGGKPSPPPAVKTIVAVPIVELLPPDSRPSLVREKRRQPDANVVSVALNLRHCVFLI